MATGACSLEDPQPKLAPPIMTGYCVFISPSWMYLPSGPQASGVTVPPAPNQTYARD